MAARVNSFEGGTNGATVTAAGSGGASGDAFTSVLAIAPDTLVFDNTKAAHGTLSAKLTGGSSANVAACYYDPAVAATNFGVRAYFYLTALPTADHWLVAMYAADHNTRLLSMHINGAGKLRLSDATGTSPGVWTAAAAMPLNQWVRIEMFGSCGSTTSSSTVKAGVYLGDSTTPIEATYSTAAGNLGAAQQFGRIIIGKVNSSTFSTPYWVDDIKADDTAVGLPGPFVVAVGPPTTATTQQATAVVTATGAAGSGGTLAYSIAQTAGTTTAPILVSSGKWEIPRHLTSTLTYLVTATESPSGLTSTSNVTVTPGTSTGGGDRVRIRNATNTAWS